MIGNTKILISSYSHKWSLGFRKFRPDSPKPLSWFIDKAKAYGIDGVQIADNVQPENLPQHQTHELFKYANESKVELQWGFEGWEKAKVERMIEICALTQSKILRGVFGRDFVADALDREARIKKALTVITEVLPQLEEQQIVLALENHFDLKFHELLEVLNTLEHPLVKGCLDTTNALGEIITPLQTVEAMAPLSVCMHFKDFKVTKIIGGYTILGVAVGEGDQDCMSVLSKALRINPAIEVCIELGSSWPEDESRMFEIEKREVEISVANTKKYLTSFYSARGRVE
jgi:sugar phosphate isomerase/epimerase